MKKPSMKKCLNVSIGAHAIVERINMSRKQDVNIADTVDHILSVYAMAPNNMQEIKP